MHPNKEHAEGNLEGWPVSLLLILVRLLWRIFGEDFSNYCVSSFLKKITHQTRKTQAAPKEDLFGNISSRLQLLSYG